MSESLFRLFYLLKAVHHRITMQLVCVCFPVTAATTGERGFLRLRGKVWDLAKPKTLLPPQSGYYSWQAAADDLWPPQTSKATNARKQPKPRCKKNAFPSGRVARKDPTQELVAAGRGQV